MERAVAEMCLKYTGGLFCGTHGGFPTLENSLRLKVKHAELHVKTAF